MPTIVDQAVPIRHWDFSETSQTVSLFCREHGVVRGLAKGAKREKANFSGGFELLTLGQIVAIVKPSSDFATLTEWDLQDVFWGPRRYLSCHHAGLYIADLLHHAIRDHDPHPALFDALVESLRELEEPANRAGVLLRFQWRLLLETGYKPELGTNAASGSVLPEGGATYGFSPAAGGLVADPAAGGPGGQPRAKGDRGETVAGPTWRVRRETVELLRRFEGQGEPRVEGAVAGEGTEAAVSRASRLLGAYLTWVLDRDLPTRRMALGEESVGPSGQAGEVAGK